MPIKITNATDVQPGVPEWLWRQRLPRGRLGLFDALPGLGKSRSLYSLSGMLIGGLCLPGETAPRPPGVVALASAEDPESVVVDCVAAAGGCRERLILLNHGTDTRLLSPQGFAELTALVSARRVELLILDPLQSWIDEGMLAEGGRVRPVLSGLVGLAANTGAAVLAVRHLVKQAGGMSTVYQGGVAAILAGTARSILRLDPDPTDAKKLVLWQAKNNLGPKAPPLSLQIVGRNGQPMVEWLGPSSVDAETLFGSAARHLGKRLAAAIQFLVLELRSGPQFVRFLRQSASHAGHSWGTILRAADALGVESYRDGGGAGQLWFWALDVKQPLARQVLMADLTDRLFHERPAAPAQPFDGLLGPRPEPDNGEAAGEPTA